MGVGVIDPAVLRALQAAGATTDMIIAAVEASNAVVEQRKAAKRANNAERQRRWRERQRNENNDSNALQGVSNVVPLSPLSPPQTPPHTPHTHGGMTTRAREADPFPKPDWCETQVWRDLRANRKAKRLPCTPTAHAKLLRDIEKLTDDDWPPGRLLEAIVARGWAAAYDPREGHNGQPHHKIQRSGGEGVDRRSSLARAIDEGLANLE